MADHKRFTMEANRVNSSGVPYWTIKPTYEAGCNDCDGRWAGNNAQAVASQHAKAHRHQTWVDIYTSVVYCGEQIGD